MKDTPLLHQLGMLISQQIMPDDLPEANWTEIVFLARNHGVSPMLQWALHQHGREILPDNLAEILKASSLWTAAQYMRLHHSFRQVNAALMQAGIPALWLKGIALAHTIYPRSTLRSMGDLDVLVPYEQRQRALEVVEALGYHFYETNGQLVKQQRILELNQTHHFHLRGGVADAMILELHFRLLGNDDKLLSLDRLAWFWTQTEMITYDGDAMTILRPEAHLLYLIAHALLQHGDAEISLRQFLDMHLLIVDSTLDWNLVVEQSAAFGWNYAVARALTLTSHYFATPIPAGVLQSLQGNTQPDASAQWAIRLSSRGARLEKLLSKLDNMSFRDKVYFLRRVLFPPKKYMRTRYHLRPEQRVWPSYFYRWWSGFRIVGWAMWDRL